MRPRSPHSRKLLLLSLLALLLTAVTLSTRSAFTSGGVFAGANLFVPLISASKVDTLVTDTGTPGPSAGDTLRYTVTINNSGTDASSVTFADTIDANTTLVPGSVNTSPVAVNDSYSALGNVSLSIPVGNGLLSNDFDADGTTPTVTSAPSVSAQGGNVVVNANGSFSYNPPAGFEGLDSFSYTIGDGTFSDTATVAITVSGMIWFVDNNAAACTSLAAGCGRLSNPLSSLAAFQALNNGSGNNPAAGDNIFLFESATDYTGNVTLLNNQKLIGQDATAALATIAGVSVPTFSASLPATNSANGVLVTVTNAGGSAITTGSGNRIQGLTVGASNTGISATNFGTLTIRDLVINGPAQAVNFNNGTLDSIIGAVTVSNRTGTGLFMDTVAGTAQFGATSIPNPLAAGGYGIRIEDSSAAVTFASATISNTNQTVATTDPGADGNPDTDGDGDAIFLKNNTGSFTLNGGTLSNLETDGIDCRSCQNLSLNGVTINQIGVNSGNVTTVDDAGIFAINLRGTNLIQNSTISRFHGSAAGGAERGIYLLNTSGNNLTELRLNNTDIFNDVALGLRGDDAISYRGQGAVNAKIVLENGCAISNISGLGIEADTDAGSTGTLELDVLDSTFTNNFAAAVGSFGGGIDVQTAGSPAVDIEIRRSNFTGLHQGNANAGIIMFAPQQTAGSFLAVVDGCDITGTFTGGGRSGRGGINLRTGDLAGEQLKNLSLTINDCDINDIGDDGIFLDIRGESLTGAGATTGNLRITNNRIGTATQVGQDGLEGVTIRIRNNLTTAVKTLNLLMDNNQIRNNDNSTGDETVDIDVEPASTLNATVTGNTFTSNGLAQDEFRASAENADSTMCLDLRNNVATQGAGPAGNGSLTVEELAGAVNLRHSGNSPAATVGVGVTIIATGCSLPSLLAPVETNAAPQSEGGGNSASVFERARQWLRPVFSAFVRPKGYFNLAKLGNWLTPTAAAAERSAEPASNASVAMSGETVTRSIPLIPAGKTITVTFLVTINTPVPPGVCLLSNQGAVSGPGFGTVLTDDPAAVGTANPTTTSVDSPPVISACPTNITTNVDAGLCTATVNFSAPTATGCPTPTVVCSPASGTAFPKGTTTVTCTATNSAGTDSCSFTVTVNDNQGPTLAGCPTNIVQNTDPSLCSAAVTFATPTATDACDGARTVTCTPPSGSTFPKGTTTVSCSASDTAGNNSSCSFTVTVNDNQGPTLTGCPTNITLNTDTGACSAVATFTPPTANDVCDGPRTVTCTPASGTAFPKGTTTVNCSASDTLGNTSSCSFTVTVNDNQGPVVACPSPISVTESSPGSGSATATFSVTANDICDGARTVTCTPPSGSSFSLGTTTVNCSASDTAGNSGSCSFTVTVTQSCSISCPTNIVTNNNPGQCGKNVTYTPPTPSGCGTVTCSPTSGSFFPVGTTTVNCSTTAGPSCSFTVTVNDNEGPMITCPTAINAVTDSTTGCTAAVAPVAPTAVDNCGGTPTVTGARSDGQPINAPYPVGATTITWTATDSANNSSSCQQTVTVTNPNPTVTITAPASGAIFAKGASVTFTGSFTDNPGTHTATWTFDSITVPGTVNETAGTVSATYSFANAGVYLVTLTVNDNCGGTGTANTIGELTALVVIYDPSAGFVTGGGWINSPPGAYPADPTLTGKANFGFVSKYKNGANVPTGDTEFQFKAGNLNFKSTSYEWLVVAGPKAQFKGQGTINNTGDYRFILTAIDGQRPGGGGQDKFRIRIWNNAGGGQIYDNQLNAPDSDDPTTVLGGGSIVIHTNGNGQNSLAKNLLAANDFDGDSKSDVSVWRGEQSDWRIVQSSDNVTQSVLWGASFAPYRDVMATGDYDGDGKTDVAVFRRGNGHWYIKQSSDGGEVDRHWGLGSDTPVPGDYDGDGKTDIAVWRGSDTRWYVIRSSDGSTLTQSWGGAAYGDVPVPGDYDGDGKTDFAVFRRSNGHWYIKQSSDGVEVDRFWGLGTDVPVPGDYDGDGKVDIAVWRGTTGQWYVQRSSDDATFTIAWGGNYAPYFDVPVPGDYDGDGKFDIAIWRPNEGAWYIRNSSDDAMRTVRHGQRGDAPVTGKTNP